MLGEIEVYGHGRILSSGVQTKPLNVSESKTKWGLCGELPEEGGYGERSREIGRRQGKAFPICGQRGAG
jgi:hypothetical protein